MRRACGEPVRHYSQPVRKIQLQQAREALPDERCLGLSGAGETKQLLSVALPDSVLGLRSPER